MKYLSVTLLFLFLALSAFGQQRKYSYISDKRFYGPEDLIGYDFVPNAMEIRDETEREFRAGEYSFGVSARNLYVEGPDVQGVYNLSSINTTDFGYQLSTVNARDARLQGHLKVILNKWREAEALIFKRSPQDPEMIFFLPLLPDHVREKETAYFTDRRELFFQHFDSIWGTVLYPFRRIHLDSRIQERLQVEDSVSVRFQQLITLEPKGKAKKKKQDEASELLFLPDSLLVDIHPDSIPEYDPELYKEERNYFVIIKSLIRYDDGGMAFKEWKYPVRKVEEKSDSNAGPNEERYLLLISLKGADPIELFLFGDRSAGSIAIDGKRYFVRGY